MEKEKRSLFQRFLLWREKNIKEKLTQAGKSIDTDWAVEKGKSFLSAAKDADTLDT